MESEQTETADGEPAGDEGRLAADAAESSSPRRGAVEPATTTDVAEPRTTRAETDDDGRRASRRAANLLSSVAWTVMSLFSLALAAGAAVLALQRGGLVAVGLAVAAVAVAMSAAYFLYHLWGGVDVDAQEF